MSLSFYFEISFTWNFELRLCTAATGMADYQTHFVHIEKSRILAQICFWYQVYVVAIVHKSNNNIVFQLYHSVKDNTFFN